MLYIKNTFGIGDINVTVKITKNQSRLLLMCAAIYIAREKDSGYMTRGLILNITSLFKDNTDVILNETELEVIYQWLSVSCEFIAQEDKDEVEEIKTQLFNILHKNKQLTYV